MNIARAVVWAIVASIGCGGAGCGSSDQSSSGSGNLGRCQAACDSFCLVHNGDGHDGTQQDVSACTTACLGYTDGLGPACAQCVVGGITGRCEAPTTPQFNSPGSAECLPLCAPSSPDASR